MTRFSNLLATTALAAGLAFACVNASAQMHDMSEHAGHTMTPAAQDDTSTTLSAGEIKKIDKDSGKLTIQHGPLTNLGMPGMTMVFKVQEPSMLDHVKAGDKVRFQAERVNGVLTVTKLELGS